MTASARAARLVVLGLIGELVGAGSGCVRADLYPVTNATTVDGGGADGGGADGVTPVTCSSPALQPGDTVHTVLVGGTDSRTYLLHVPPAYDGTKPVPLVLDFHGLGASGADERGTSSYPAVLDPEGVVMAFPDGVRGPAGTAWNLGPCCVGDVDDVAFTRAVVAQIQTIACIDRPRVYAVGALTGGGMAHYLACHAADLFAAAAPAGFDLLKENVDGCTPPRPITVISFRGTADSKVPYAGGPSSLIPMMPVTFLGAQATFEAWARIITARAPRRSLTPQAAPATRAARTASR